jgi:hypothetical protein
MSESVEERSKEEEGMGTLHGSGSLSEGDRNIPVVAQSKGSENSSWDTCEKKKFRGP